MRKLFAVFFALCLLMQISAGMAMQVDMIYGMMKSNAATQTQVLSPCHEALNDVGSSNVADVSACSLCCMAVALPNVMVSSVLPIQHPVPIAVLFNNLPADAQRPAKPPLV